MLDKNEFYARKKNATPISMLTVYDAAFARMAEAAGLDTLLVGDSAANVVLGYASTRDIGMDEMIIFTAAVRRGAPRTHIVSDMPFGSDSDPAQALVNARRLVEAGANAVKIEGTPIAVIKYLRENNIEVVGHLGLLPQTATSFKQKGNTPAEAEKILADARILDALDLCALVVEHIPESLGALVAQAIQAPVIGIGAGHQVDGQVLVLHDALGMHPFKIPPFATRFANLWEQGVEGMRRYVEAVYNRAS
jgi:3-methyl-2-oxobutanoate hydroxymethyltransferase